VPTEKRARQKARTQARREAERRAQRRRTYLRRGLIILGVAVVVAVPAYFITKSNGNSSASSTTTTAKGGTTTSTTTPSTTTSSVPAADAAAQTAANAKAVAYGCPASPSTRVNTYTWTSAPAMTIDKTKTYTATVDTTAGTFVITLDAKTAPQTVNSFVFLAQHNFYKCVIFHRVIPQFMDQTGDPTGTGQGGPGYTIPDEYPAKAANSSQQYPLGSVAMANELRPNTGGSQWFVVAGPEGESLSNQYTLFGQVTSGMSVVDLINSQGNPNPQASGVPPLVTQRILNVTISSS